MASLALSVVGSAIGGPAGGMIGGFVGGLLDNLLFPANNPPPVQITSSTYGKAIPRIWGQQVRVGCNMIWTSGWRNATGKTAKQAELKGLPPGWVCDVALAVAAGPLNPDWVIKIFANGNLIFDSTVATARPTPDATGVVTWESIGVPPHGTSKDFASMLVYPGNNLQNPDPTMEAALGVGNCPSYRGTAYIVINGLIGTSFGNSVPVMQILCQPNTAGVKLNEVVNDIVTACGIDPTKVSTSSLSAPVMGYMVDSQVDGVTALQPLALVFNFDLAEVAGELRFSPRGQEPLCTITSSQLAGHQYGGARPSYQWPREAEVSMPKVAALTFIDPDRDCQENTQSAERATGSSNNRLMATCRVTMDSETGRQVADRLLWEAQIGRQSFTAAADDRLGFVESARTYAIEVPFGYETIRVTKRSRGANNVIEFEGKRDAPAVYVSAAPSADANSAPNTLGLGGPVNPPVFIEPPAGFPGVTGAQLIIAISGGEGGEVNDAWGGCQVYVATDDATGDYQLAGLQIGAAVMGVTTHDLPNYSGTNPDQNTITGHVLSVDTSESGGEPQVQSFLDASLAQTVCLVGTEFMSIQHVSAVGGNVYNLTDLWRGQYNTDRGDHPAGTSFVQVDSQVFRMNLAAAYVGVELFFRFVSAGESLANVATYSYTPQGVVAAVSGATAQITASEAIAAGALINLWTDGGNIAMRNANATDTTKSSDGFVKVAVSSGATAPYFANGETNDALSGLTPGATYYLDTTAGQITATPPATSGNGLQTVGKALSASELAYQGGAMTAVP